MYGISARIGIILPANNSVLEPELWSRAPEGVALYVTRILVTGTVTPEAVRQMESKIDLAVDELCATGVDMLVYADMVTSFIMEPGWNQTRSKEIASRAGVPCMSAWMALKKALVNLGVRRLALGTPYPANIHALCAPFFAREGYQVVADTTFDILDMSDVPKITPERLRGLVSGLDRRDAEAIVLLATDLPTFSEVANMEAESGLPVLTSNQTILWAALEACGMRAPIAGLGRLFET